MPLLRRVLLGRGWEHDRPTVPLLSVPRAWGATGVAQIVVAFAADPDLVPGSARVDVPLSVQLLVQHVVGWLGPLAVIAFVIGLAVCRRVVDAVLLVLGLTAALVTVWLTAGEEAVQAFAILSALVYLASYALQLTGGWLSRAWLLGAVLVVFAVVVTAVLGAVT